MCCLIFDELDHDDILHKNHVESITHCLWATCTRYTPLILRYVKAASHCLNIPGKASLLCQYTGI